MKKYIALFIVLALIIMGAVAIRAEEAQTDVAQATSKELSEVTEYAETPAETAIATPSYNYAEGFVQYIFSGEEGADELMNNIIAMGEQYKNAKEAGYTLEERIAQLVTPENIVTVVAAAFLIVCGLAFFVIERRRKLDRLGTRSDVKTLKEQYLAEVASNTELKTRLEMQGSEISEIKALICELKDKTDATNFDMSKVTVSATAVAKMVKDVFLNSKTIDASGKALLVHNYMEVIGGDVEVPKATGDESNERQI